MTPDELKIALDDAKADLAKWRDIRNSPGYSTLMGKWANFKSNDALQGAVCGFFQITKEGLAGVIKDVDKMLALGDSIAAKADERIKLADSLEAHPGILWTLARLLS